MMEEVEDKVRRHYLNKEEVVEKDPEEEAKKKEIEKKFREAEKKILEREKAAEKA